MLLVVLLLSSSLISSAALVVEQVYVLGRREELCTTVVPAPAHTTPAASMASDSTKRTQESAGVCCSMTLPNVLLKLALVQTIVLEFLKHISTQVLLCFFLHDAIVVEEANTRLSSCVVVVEGLNNVVVMFFR